ncbi:hypothetical protein GLOIN_2v1848952 [Rhizophagus clarus]|uniref:Uncharacterized protein n=1 Tax=Rhizophagus clarus TaxID=94130 RepID=A0A8H3L813_9GLOM|nr:hypothetical protein GLOIN_2v1848952 [Rhizophagus clarus]
MVFQCPQCEKNDFKKTRDLTNHLNRKFKCKQTQISNSVQPSNPNISSSQSPTPNPSSPVVHIHEKEGSKKNQATDLSIEDLANWLANPKIKNNPNIISKKILKTDVEWFDLMEKSTQAYREGQRKKVTPAPEVIDQKDGSKDDPKDLDKIVPWPVSFPDNERHREVWQKGIQTAKDMFKVDGAEYTFSTWFAKVLGKELTNILLSARSEKQVAKKVKEVYLQRGLCNEKAISEKIESLIREYKAEDKGSSEWIAFIEEHFELAEMYEAGMTKEHAKKILDVIDDNRFLIRVKFVRDNSSYDGRHNYAFKIVDKYQPIRESKRAGKKFVPEDPNVILTKKTKPGFWVEIDEKFLVKIIQSENQSEYIELDINAVVYGLYQIWESDSKRLMLMKDGTLNCVAQRVIEHFEKAKRGYGLTSTRKQKIGTWEKRICQPGAWIEDVAELEKIFKRSIKLLDITHGSDSTIFNSGKYRAGRFEEIEMVVHNGHAFPKNHHLPRDRMVEYYSDNAWNAINKALQGPQAIWLIGLGLREGETLEEIQSISQFILEDGRIFRTWMKQTDIIKACKELFKDAVDWQFWKGIINEERKRESLESLKIVELAEQVFGANHAGGKLANEINDWHPTPAIEDVIYIDMKEYYPASMRGQGECSPWFKQFGHSTYHLVRVAVNRELPPDNITVFAQVRSFRFVSNIHSVIPVWYGKHFACRSGEECGKTKSWTPIVLLRYLLEAGILESVTIGEATISLTKQTKIENVSAFFKQAKCPLNHKEGADTSKFQYPHKIPSCAICEAGVFYSKKAVEKFAKEVKYFRLGSQKNICSLNHRFWDDLPQSLDKRAEKKIREIHPGQWRDKGEKIHGPDPNVVYWPKNRHWESIKNITESITPSIHDPITRS